MHAAIGTVEANLAYSFPVDIDMDTHHYTSTAPEGSR